MRVNWDVVGRAISVGVVCLGELAALPGCSSSDGGSGPAAPTLNPPANIDIKLCASITGDFSTIADSCGACCTQGGFSESTWYDNECVCGKEAQTDTSCTAMDQASCPTCCTAAGFSGYAFFGDASSSTCSCSGKVDSEVCLPAASDGDVACRVCCLNHGYLGDEYSDVGSPQYYPVGAGAHPECTCRG